MKKHLDEVLKTINQLPGPIPAHRAAFKKGFSFSAKSFEEQLSIWDFIWKHAAGFRPRVHAFFFLERFVTKKELLAAIWKASVSWQEDVDDWGLCDALAKLNTKALEAHPGEVYSQLAAWNKSENLWKRRQSVVSLLYFSRTKKIFLPFSKIAALVSPILTDREYYVQKGVGWALREMFTVYPKETMPFLERHIKSISGIAFTIAIEKMDDAQKNFLKGRRK